MEIIVDDEYVIEHEQEELHIVEEFEVINHNYKILIGTVTTDRYTKYLFKATKYENNICISEFGVYTANADLSKEINDICMDYSNIECTVTTVKLDNTDNIYGIKIRPIYNSNYRCLVFTNRTWSWTTDPPSYITTFIYNYLSNHLYLFDINNEYVLK